VREQPHVVADEAHVLLGGGGLPGHRMAQQPDLAGIGRQQPH